MSMITEQVKALKEHADYMQEIGHLFTASIIRHAADTIEQLAAKVRAKIGHWITTGDYYTGAYGNIDYVECSCCHEYSLEEGDFCPNCGVKMVEPQESE